MCFVWIWEQTASISLYSINWLVFITETECVYCAVRTGYLYIVQVMCFVWIWEQTASISLYSINWLVFITETECVYCAVRIGYLYMTLVKTWSLKCLPVSLRGSNTEHTHTHTHTHTRSHIMYMHFGIHFACLTRDIKPLITELNPTCHLLALLGAHHILHVSRIRVNQGC